MTHLAAVCLELSQDSSIRIGLSDPESGIQMANISLYTDGLPVTDYLFVGTKTIAAACQNGTLHCACSLAGNCYKTEISVGFDSLHPAEWNAVHGQALHLVIKLLNTAGASTTESIAMEIDTYNPQPGDHPRCG